MCASLSHSFYKRRIHLLFFILLNKDEILGFNFLTYIVLCYDCDYISKNYGSLCLFSNDFKEITGTLRMTSSQSRVPSELL